MHRVAHERVKRLQWTAPQPEQLRIEAPQDARRLPGPHEARVGDPQRLGRRQRRSQIVDLAQPVGQRQRLGQRGVVLERREDVEEIVLELEKILEDVPRPGVEEVDEPHVPLRVEDDVRAVQVAVDPGHPRLLLRAARQIGQRALVEPADVPDRAAGDQELVARGLIANQRRDPATHRRGPARAELVVGQQIARARREPSRRGRAGYARRSSRGSRARIGDRRAALEALLEGGLEAPPPIEA